jgi:cysteine-rich repeat protein
MGLDDGTPCVREGIAAPLICLGGLCSSSRCGDGILDARPKVDGSIEACDDGNDEYGDGCEPDCTTTVGCATDGDCLTLGIPCQVGRCDLASGGCSIENDLDGSPCSDGTGNTGICNAGECGAANCGNGSLDTDEICDDGNTNAGDGCSPFCKPECESDDQCVQDACFGFQRCEVSTGPTGQMGLCVLDTDRPVTSCAAPCEVCDSIAGGCVPSIESDADFDGYRSIACGGDDCDDTRAVVNPGAAETCGDGVDANCNGNSDEGAIATWYADCDGDNYAEPSAETIPSCGAPTVSPSRCDGAWTVLRPSGTTVDCLDTDPAVHPGVRKFSAAPYLTPAGESSFDYDCDGVESPEYPRVLSPSTAACDTACRTAGPLLALGTSCGDAATRYECQLVSGSCTRVASRVRYYLACR